MTAFRKSVILDEIFPKARWRAMSNQSELPQQQMGDQVHSRKEIVMKTIDKDVLAGYNAGVEKGPPAYRFRAD